MKRTRVLDPRTGRTVLTTRWGILGVAGRKLVLAGPGSDLTLLDAAGVTERRVPWRSWPPGAAVVAPGGRLVALASGTPSWQLTGKQVLDLWLLDTKTRKLNELPGMPTFVRLKQTSLAWTDDGRLVLLAQDGNGNDMVGVWRPGQQRLALKTVQLPDRYDSGSASFAPIE